MSIRRRTLLVVALACSSVLVPVVEAASILLPGNTLRVEFSTLDPLCPGGPCDVLTVMPVSYGSWDVEGGAASLYDGSIPLGIDDSPELCCVWDFVSSSSAFTARNPATVDFNNLLSGIMGGHIDVSISSGQLTFPSGPAVHLQLGRGAGPGVIEGGSGIFVTSVTILQGPLSPPATETVPEPGAFGLVTAGLVVVASGRLRRPLKHTRG
jgi:hypothetical protein